MSTIERISITLPIEMAATLRRTVEGGQYASTSEIICEALREWSGRRDEALNDLQALREAVRIGDESGTSIPVSEVFTELRQMISRRRATPNEAARIHARGAKRPLGDRRLHR